MEPFNRVCECRYGPQVYNRHDRYVGRSLELYGEFSPGEADLFRQVIRPGDIVVEAGANVGAHTLHLARLVGSGGRILAFEPQRLCFQALCATMALNSIPHAYCHHLALGDRRGAVLVPQLDPHRSHNFGGLSLARPGRPEASEPVAVAPLDDFRPSRCRLIKVDVEGMELEVLRGADATIRSCRPVLYVENDRRENSPVLLSHIVELGYSIYLHNPPLFAPGNFRGNGENVFGRVVSKNLLCLPEESRIAVQGLEPAAVRGG